MRKLLRYNVWILSCTVFTVNLLWYFFECAPNTLRSRAVPPTATIWCVLLSWSSLRSWMRCDRLLFSIIELIAESLNSLLGGLMIALVVILTRRRRCSWRRLGRRTTDWASVKRCLMALKHLRLFSISWRPGLRYSWGSRIVICLFHDIRSTLMMLILLTKRSYLLSLSFKTWKNSVWVDIFFILIGSLWTLCNWWFTHHWWFRWETLCCVIGSWDSIIFRGVNIGGSRLSWRGTRRRNTCLLFLLFFIFFWSLSRSWISWLI